MLRLVQMALASAAIVFAVMTIAANVLPRAQRPAKPQGELYAPQLASIDTLDKAEVWIRARLSKPKPSEAEIADRIEHFLRLRFFHEVSYFQFNDNWLAYMAGFVRENLATPVRPDDLLRYDRGICSQQTLVMQALLERFGIDYATIGFDQPAHMTPGARIDGVWALYDSDIEPNRTRVVPFAEVLKGDVLVDMYRGKTGRPEYGFDNDIGLQWQQAARKGLMVIKDVNVNPATRGAAFHSATEFMSGYGWFAFALLTAISHAPVPAWPKVPGRIGPAAPVRRVAEVAPHLDLPHQQPLILRLRR